MRARSGPSDVGPVRDPGNGDPDADRGTEGGDERASRSGSEVGMGTNPPPIGFVRANSLTGSYEPGLQAFSVGYAGDVPRESVTFPKRRIARIPSAGPRASTGNAHCHPATATIAGTPWMVTMVSRKPMEV